jgi:transporter family-2 protein
VLLVLVLGRTRRAIRPAVAARLPWWNYLGGLGGAGVVLVGAASAPVIGIAAFTVGLVAGQAVGGLLIDRTRLAGPARPLSGWRIAGAALAVVGVGAVDLGRDGGPVAGDAALWLLLAAGLSGVAAAAQAALNGRVQRSTGEPLLATAANFAVGTAALAVASAVLAASGHGPRAAWPSTPVLYVGGVFGICVIATAAWTVQRLGVLRLGLVFVAGQLAGGTMLDLLSPERAGGVNVETVAGVLLAALAVAAAGRTGRAPPIVPLARRAAVPPAAVPPGHRAAPGRERRADL